jgi:hypothetical protein
MSKPRFVNRLATIERVLTVADLLRGNPNGLRSGQLNRLAGAKLGQHSTRTTIRDLRLLERLGQVKHDESGNWLWNEPKQPRAKKRA